MPRGRHRHSPPLHRLLPPSAIAAVSLVCAVGPWLFTEAMVLRGLAGGAALTAVLGAVVMRRWDWSAGKQVADLERARVSDEWRFEERVAELETDLDESRELRVKLEHKLRAKRTELAGLRNEHAALLRRYATAETERATALEGRRLLEIETIETPDPEQDPALTASEEPADSKTAEGTEATETAEATEATETLEASDAAEGSEAVSAGPDADGADGDFGAVDAGEAAEGQGVEAQGEADAPKSPEVFSPSGSSLFLRANAALNRIANGETETAPDAALETTPETDSETDPATENAPDPDGSAPSESAHEGSTEAEPETGAGAEAGADTVASASEGAAAAGEGEAAGKPEAVGGHEPAAAEAKPAPASPAQEAPSSASPQSTDPADHTHPSTRPDRPTPPERPTPQRPVKPIKPVRPAPSAGHFTVPTAVAVAPAAPVRRPSVEGGFDFFGTQQESSPETVQTVQNEDLADVVGEEALALHKAEAEAGFKPADEESRGVGQVIDLTVHDETERIDMGELRSAVS
ncbi:hypothetical protein ACIPC1_16785 [Streptomyces sp. NPDC087263]|uniref:hypothetical protein n=1 Tax=Streptomyces sp. NPDC087263 TaxID=3365773 RepID=UPI00380C219A